MSFGNQIGILPVNEQWCMERYWRFWKPSMVSACGMASFMKFLPISRMLIPAAHKGMQSTCDIRERVTSKWQEGQVLQIAYFWRDLTMEMVGRQLQYYRYRVVIDYKMCSRYRVGYLFWWLIRVATMCNAWFVNKLNWYVVSFVINWLCRPG